MEAVLSPGLCPGVWTEAAGEKGVRTGVFWARLGLWSQVLPKRTNLPGISSTDRGGLRGHPGTRAGPFPGRSLHGGTHFRTRGWTR